MHVAATYDGAALKLYINGVLQKSATAAITIGSNTDVLSIGRMRDSSNFFGGKMDEVRIYNRALSLAEIGTLAGHTITATAGANGAISPTGNVNVLHNANQTFAITADPGYGVSNVIVDGVSQGPITSYTFTAVTRDHTINATFVAGISHTIDATAGANGSISPSGSVSVPDAGSQTFTITPNTGYHIADVLVDLGSVGAVTSYTFNNVIADHSISASFAINTYTLALSTSGNGTAVKNPDQTSYNYHTSVTLTATPTGGSSFIGWSGSVIGATNPITVYTDSNMTVVANFGDALVARWAMDEGSGTTLIDASTYGNNGTIKGAPAWTPGVHDKALLLNGLSQYAVVPSSPSLNLTGRCTFAAWIRPYNHGTYRIVAKVTGSAGYEFFLGSVSPYPVSVRFNGTSRLDSRTTYPTDGNTWMHVAATADGTTLKMYVNGVLDTSLTSAALPATCTDSIGIGANSNGTNFYAGALDEVRMYNRALTLSEIQALASHTITATSATGGSISPAGAVSVLHKADQTFTLTPDPGYSVLNVTVDGVSQGAISSYTFASVIIDHTISAMFVTTSSHTITATAGANGSISPSGAVSVPDGGSQTFTIAPASGYHIADVLVDGGTVGPVTTYTFNNVTTDHTIGASFAITPLLAGYWAMDEGSGTTLIDASTYGNNGTIFGSPSWVTGIKGQALNFAGSQYAAVRDTPSLRISSAITLAAWIAPAQVATQRIVAKAWMNNTNGYELSLASTGKVFFRLNQNNGTGGYRIDSNTPYPSTGTTWVHAAATYDGDSLRLYINGAKEAAGKMGVPIGTNMDSLYIGRQKDGQYYYLGRMDEVRMYNRALTLSEIQALASHTITANAGPNGSISPSDAVSVIHGGSQLFTITPSGGYHIDSVIVNGAYRGTMSSYTFTNVQTDSTIRAVFATNTRLLSPLDGTSGVSLSPTLNIAAYDSSGDPMTATFYGKPHSGSTGENFTIIELPDAQNYSLSSSGSEIMKAQTQWIINQRAVRNIVFVNQIGDIVEDGDTSPIEWSRVDTAMWMLEDPVTTGLPEGIPYGVSVGNHEQTPTSDPHGTTTYFNQYFGSGHFAGRSYYGGHWGSNNDNSFQLFSASGMNFIVVNFEYDPSPEPAVLHWADSLLKAYSTRRAIVCDHYVMDGGNPGSFSSAGSAIYDSLKDNPNLFLMLGGHTGPEGRRVDTYGGHTVYSVLADYQGEPNGGNGWLRIMEFSPSTSEIRVKTYSPTLDQFKTGSSSQFTLSYPMDVSSYQVIGTNLNVPSGSSTSMGWPGREPLTQYDWYVTLDDGHNLTTGPTWTFTTRDTQYIITASAGANGTISPNGAVTVNHGASQSFTITPNSGYQIASVIVDGEPAATTSPYVFSNVTADHTIVAAFTPAGGSPETVTCNSTGTEYPFPLSNVTMNFSVLPPGGGTVTIRRYLETPPYPTYPNPPAGSTYLPVWFDITSTLPNNSFSGGIAVNVTDVPGFGADSKVMYYNATSGRWVLVSGTYTAGIHEFTFSTTHFTLFAFINTSATAYDVFVSASASGASAGAVYPNATWGGGYLSQPNDWGFTGTQPFDLYIVPQTGTRLGVCELIAQWDSAVVSLDTVSYAGSIFSGPNLLFAGSNRFGAGDRVTLNASLIDPTNVTVGVGDYIAQLKMRLRKPGHASVQLIGDHVLSFNPGSDPSGVYITPHQAEVKAYLGDVAAAGMDETTGDGKIDFQDLSVWSGSYWSGVAPHDMTHYKAKYDIGPTQDGYAFSLPTYDDQINFEDLVVFAITYGQTVRHQLPKVAQPQRQPMVVSLGQAEMVGNETRVPVTMTGAVTDVRAMRIEVEGQFGSLIGVEKGVLLQSYQTPVMLMSLRNGRTVYVDLAVMGLDVQGVNGEGEIVVLRFAGTTAVHLGKAECRSSMNAALPVELMKGTVGTTPTEYNLTQNYPNPFNPTTTVEYEILVRGKVSLEVYNILGVRVATLVNDVQEAGFYQVVWDGSDDNHNAVATGVYLYRVKAGDFNSVKKMLLLK